jgi:hypothetical protein
MSGPTQAAKAIKERDRAVAERDAAVAERDFILKFLQDMGDALHSGDAQAALAHIAALRAMAAVAAAAQPSAAARRRITSL